MITTEHKCEYPEKIEGHWLSIGKCIHCATLPPYEYVEAKMKSQRPRKSKQT